MKAGEREGQILKATMVNLESVTLSESSQARKKRMAERCGLEGCHSTEDTMCWWSYRSHTHWLMGADEDQKSQRTVDKGI